MASSSHSQNKESTGGSQMRSRPTEFIPGIGDHACFVKGAGRSAATCGTCKGSIGPNCRALKHVARCTATANSDRPCDLLFSTNYGCFKHPYRDGYNPEMRAHSHLVTGVLPGVLDWDPVWAAEIQRKVLENRIRTPPLTPKRVPWEPYVKPTGPNALPESQSWPLKWSPKKPKQE